MKGSCRGKKVLIGISGGVDSTCALLLLKSQGYDVEALFLDTGFNSHLQPLVERICQKLKINLSVLDIRDKFSGLVSQVVEDYRLGRTPNPCILCNEEIKFHFLMKVAKQRRIGLISTGHYADKSLFEGKQTLMCSRDISKDQTYFLYRILPYLNRVYFPLASILRKEAEEMVFSVFGRDEIATSSKDLCFAGGKMKDFISSRVSDNLGCIVDRDGQILGRHRGIHHFTIGQRIGIEGVEKKERWYVVDLLPRRNLVVVAPFSKSKASGLRANSVVSVCDLDEIEIEAKIRYNQKNIPVQVNILGDGKIEVFFDTPQQGVARGQHIVFYKGSMVVGGGRIIEVIW